MVTQAWFVVATIIMTFSRESIYDRGMDTLTRRRFYGRKEVLTIRSPNAECSVTYLGVKRNATWSTLPYETGVKLLRCFIMEPQFVRPSQSAV